MAVQAYLTNFIAAYNAQANGNAYVGGTQNTINTEAWALQGHGVSIRYMQGSVSLLASDSIASTYLLLKNIPGQAIIEELWLEVDAMSGLTSASIGLFNPLTGAAFVNNCYLSAADIHLASTKLAPYDGMAALTHENTLQTVCTLAGKTIANPSTDWGCYDLVLTANTAPVQAGVITARIKMSNPG
jgi:hypothetical protein